MAVKVTRGQSVMALYQKIVFTRSTICVESFIIVSQSARNAHCLCYAAPGKSYIPEAVANFLKIF